MHPVYFLYLKIVLQFVSDCRAIKNIIEKWDTASRPDLFIIIHQRMIIPLKALQITTYFYCYYILLLLLKSIACLDYF
jgi:hypothetical protein